MLKLALSPEIFLNKLGTFLPATQLSIINMKNVFLLLAITGIAAPYYFIYKFIEANNWEWSTTLFFEHINANAGMKILNADLTVAATTFLIFIIYKRSINALSTKRFLTYFASLFIVGFSLALPLYMYHNYKN